MSAFGIVHAQSNAIVVTEIKFGEIAMKMLLAAMLVRAFHAALEHAEIAFDGVGRDDRFTLTADVFVILMIDGIVLGKLSANPDADPYPSEIDLSSLR